MAKFTLFNNPRTISQTLNDSLLLLRALPVWLFILSGLVIVSYFAVIWLQTLFTANLYLVSVLSLLWIICFSAMFLVLLSVVSHVAHQAELNTYVFMDQLKTSLVPFICMTILFFAFLYIIWKIFFLSIFFAIPFVLIAYPLQLFDNASLTDSICDAIDLVWANYFYALGVALPITFFLCLLWWLLFSLLIGVIPGILSQLIAIVAAGLLLSWLACIVVLLHYNLKKYEYGGW